MATLKANKRLTFVRDGGDKVIEAGETFTPDGSMDVDQMLKSGKVSEPGRAVKAGPRRKRAK